MRHLILVLLFLNISNCLADEVDSMFNKFEKAYKKTKHEEALSYAVEASRMIQTSLANADQTHLGKVKQVGVFLLMREEFSECVNLFSSVVDSLNEVEGSNKFLLVGYLNNLGVAYCGLEDFIKAQSCLRKAVSLDQKLLEHEKGEEASLQIACVINNYGRCKSGQKEFDKAKEILEQALESCKRVEGDKRYARQASLIRSEVLENLGVLENRTKKFDQADNRFKLAIAAIDNLGSRTSVEIESQKARILFEIGENNEQWGKSRLALKTIEEAKNRYENVFGHKHERVMRCAIHLAHLNYSLGQAEKDNRDYRNARKYFERSFQFDEEGASLAKSLGKEESIEPGDFLLHGLREWGGINGDKKTRAYFIERMKNYVVVRCKDDRMVSIETEDLSDDDLLISQRAQFLKDVMENPFVK